MSVRRTPPATPTTEGPLPTPSARKIQTSQFSGSEPTLYSPDFVTQRSCKRKMDEERRDDFHTFALEMRAMFTTFTETQSKKLSDIVIAVNSIKEQNSDIVKSIDFLSHKYEEMTQQIKNLEQAKKEDKEYINQLENKLEILERKSRNLCVELKNIPKDDKTESKCELIKTVQRVGSIVNFEISDSQIKDIYRINTKLDSNKPIIVEFTNALSKEGLLNSVKTYNRTYSGKLNTGSLLITGPIKPIFVSESLTDKSRKLFYLARDFAKTNDYRFCWSLHGVIYLRKREGSPQIRIESEEVLRNLPICK